MGSFLYIWVLPIVGGLLLYLINSAAVKAPGATLQNKFAQLTKDTGGVIKDKTLSEITAVCGQPSAVTAMGDGTVLRQWQATSYHIALLFDEDDVCLGISSEIKV